MPLDESLRDRIRSLADSVDVSAESVRDEVVRRGRRKAVSQRVVSIAAVVGVVASTSVVFQQIKHAPSTTTFGRRDSVTIPSCGSLNVRDGNRPDAEISEDGSVLALSVETDSSLSGHLSIIVCNNGKNRRIDRGRDAETWGNDPKPRKTGNANSVDGLALTPDGQTVLFDSYDKLTQDDRNDSKDIYLLDTGSMALRRFNPLPALTAPADLSNPVLIDQRTLAITFADLFGNQQVTSYFDLATSKRVAPPAILLKGGRTYAHGGRFFTETVTSYLSPTDLFRDPSARVRASIIIQGPGAARTHILPPRPPGTWSTAITTGFSSDGRLLVYAARDYGYDRFPDGSFVKSVKPGSRVAYANVYSTELGGDLAYSNRSNSRSPLHIVDLEHGKDTTVRLPDRYSDAVIVAFTPDARLVALTASMYSSRPSRNAIDVLVLDTRSKSIAVLTWSPPWWVRYDNALAWAALLALSLWTLYGAWTIATTKPAPPSAFIPFAAVLISGMGSWARVVGEGEPWWWLLAFSISAILLELTRPRIGTRRWRLARLFKRKHPVGADSI